MQKSESIKELAVALAAAQAEIMGAHKDSSNPYFNSRYADLASVWDACRTPLSKNGLSVVQTCAVDAGAVTVTTLLMHTSGEWIQGVLGMKPVREKKGEGYIPAEDPQAIGSCITYNRRYSLAAMVGVCPEDDDANIASARGASQGPARKAARDPSAGFDPTWREVSIHFGKHEGKKLGDMEAKSIHWFYAEWMPKKKADEKFPPKNPDKLLFEALEAWHAEVEEKKASEEKSKSSAKPENQNGEPPVVEVEKWQDIVCHVGKIGGEVHGKKLGDLYPANIETLKEKFHPVAGKGGCFDPKDATLYWAVRKALAEMDAQANAGAGGAK